MIPKWWSGTARPTARVLLQQHMSLMTQADSECCDSRRTRRGPCWFMRCRGHPYTFPYGKIQWYVVPTRSPWYGVPPAQPFARETIRKPAPSSRDAISMSSWGKLNPKQPVPFKRTLSLLRAPHATTPRPATSVCVWHVYGCALCHAVTHEQPTKRKSRICFVLRSPSSYIDASRFVPPPKNTALAE